MINVYLRKNEDQIVPEHGLHTQHIDLTTVTIAGDYNDDELQECFLQVFHNYIEKNKTISLKPSSYDVETGVLKYNGNIVSLQKPKYSMDDLLEIGEMVTLFQEDDLQISGIIKLRSMLLTALAQFPLKTSNIFGCNLRLPYFIYKNVYFVFGTQAILKELECETLERRLMQGLMNTIDTICECEPINFEEIKKGRMIVTLKKLRRFVIKFKSDYGKGDEIKMVLVPVRFKMIKKALKDNNLDNFAKEYFNFDKDDITY